MSKNKNGRQIACESLENRRMFVTYQVVGTSGADAISLSISGNSIISAVNGVSDSASDIINNNIQIDGMGGNDTITIVETGNNTVVINAGGGDDTINIGLGSHDLDNIDGAITVNGDSNSDELFLFDDNHVNGAAFTLSGGNGISRIDMAPITANVENVEIEGGESGDNFAVNDELSFTAVIRGNDGGDVINMTGTANETATFLPSGTPTESGVLSFESSNVNFVDVELLRIRSFGDFEFTSPKPNDVIDFNGTRLEGTNSGTAFSDVDLFQVGTMTLQLGLHDGATGNDLIGLRLEGSTSQASVIKIDAGIGTNTLTASNNVTGGITSVFTIDTTVGTHHGDNLTVINNGAVLTFDGTQILKRLQVDNGGIIRFNGVDTLLSTQALAVVDGTGIFDMAANQNVIVPATGTFSIGAAFSTRTFIKRGLGTMSVSGSQSHSFNSTLRVENGTFSLDSDAGTAAVHPLNLLAAGGTLSLGSTQHVHSVEANAGIVRMATNGSRVLVTNAVSTGSEAGAIDLRDNDMILDYTDVADAVAARALLHSGRGNGSWAGLGINSSTAAAALPKITTLGSMEATEFRSLYGPAATFDGETIDNTAVLIKFTYYGDANFNGKVDGADYSRIDATFNKEHTAGNIGGWLNGDFNDDGKVDGADYGLIDGAFNGQGLALRPAATLPPVKGFAGAMGSGQNLEKPRA